VGYFHSSVATTEGTDAPVDERNISTLKLIMILRRAYGGAAETQQSRCGEVPVGKNYGPLERDRT
jgi:hypothetical protein